MSRLLLVRHGQASFGSTNYDQLSPLGVQQSKWLGEYLADQKLVISSVLRGDLNRHEQTACEILNGYGKAIPSEVDTRWNEFDFQELGRQYLRQYPEHAPNDASPKAFFGLLRRALIAWSQNALQGELPETWSEFERRIQGALKQSMSSESKEDLTLVVTSGGAIAMALKQILDYPADKVIDINLQTRNTGLSELYYNAKHCYVTSFNTLPHMTDASRKDAITSA